MSVGTKLLLCTTGIAGLIACNPPLEENVAPSIQIQEPTTNRNFGTPQDPDRRVEIDFGQAVDFVILLRDRDEDKDEFLSLTINVDSTPDNDDDDATSLTELASIIDIPNCIPRDPPDNSIDHCELAMATVTGIPVGAPVIKVIATDGTDSRSSLLPFQVNESVSPPVPEITPANPVAGDALSGDIATPGVNPQGGPVFHDFTWQRDGDATPAVTGDVFPGILPAVNTAKNDVWAFCVNAWESEDGSAPADDAVPVQGCVSATIGNTPPGAPGDVEVQPANPTPADALRCVVNVDAADSDGDPVTYIYAWSLDGTPVPGLTDPLVDPVETAPGDAWNCNVTATDGDDDGGSLAGTAVTIGSDSIDVSTASRLISGAPGEALADSVASAPMEAVAGGDVCLGVPSDDRFGAEAGLAGVFRGSSLAPDGGLDTRTSTLSGYEVGSRLGTGLFAHDLDENGMADLLVGATGDVVGTVDPAVWILLDGSMSAPITDPTGAVGLGLLYEDLPTAEGFGAAFSAGQLDDTTPAHEVVVSRVRPGTANEVFVFDIDGATDILLTSSVANTVISDGTDDGFGKVVHAEGDVTGDGRPDLIIADPDSGGDAVWVFASSGLGGQSSKGDARATITSGMAVGIGTAVETADIDNDGVADLVVTAPGFDDGRVAIFLGGSALTGSTPFGQADLRIDAPNGSGLALGSSVATLPDVTGQLGDGLAIGASGGAGAVFVFTAADLQAGLAGTGVLTVSDASVIYDGETTGDALQTAGRPQDLDGDGTHDLVLAAPNWMTDQGRIYVFYSSLL